MKGAGSITGDECARSPALTTTTSPITSITVSTFCVRTDTRSPTMLTAVNATTMNAAHNALECGPSDTIVDT